MTVSRRSSGLSSTPPSSSSYRLLGLTSATPAAPPVPAVGEELPHAVGALLPPGYTRTYLPGEVKLHGPALPQWAYAAAAWGKRRAVTWALRTDRRDHWNPERFSTPDLKARIEKHRADVQAIAQKIISESGGEDTLKASAAERIKKLESIKPRDTLSEMEFRELQDSAGRMFRAGMGAEAIRDLLRNISLDELSPQLRLETHSPQSFAAEFRSL